MLPDNNMHLAHQYYGLMRYYSAPSSTLAGLIHGSEDLLTEDSNTFVQVEETEFAQFLDDHLCMAPDNIHSLESVSLAAASASGCDSQPHSLVHGDRPTDLIDANALKLQLQMKDESLILQEDCPSEFTTTHGSHDIATVSSLPSPILEHGAIGMNATSCGSTGMMLDAHDGTVPTRVLSAASLLEQSALHHGASSFQAVRECGMRTDISKASFFAPSKETYFHHVEKHAKPGIREVSQAQSTIYTVRHPSVETEFSSLLRQTSLPADLISHVSLDVTSPSTSRKNSSEEDSFSGGSTILSWDHTVRSQRPKHARDFHDMHTAQSSDPTFTNREASYNAKVNSGNLTSTEVLCKVSAKRGFATHPRSIAERVRRTKINEGIKKLQQVMPNMERHTNTVTMLDEAVEYVKYLQQQVQELSACSTQCRGQCHS